MNNGVDYFKKFKSTHIRNALKTIALDTFPAYAPIAQIGCPSWESDLINAVTSLT